MSCALKDRHMGQGSLIKKQLAQRPMGKIVQGMLGNNEDISVAKS